MKKSGAVVGGWVCFGLAAGFIFLPVPTFFIYGPLLLGCFALGIVALAQSRIAHGVILLLNAIVVGPILVVASLGFWAVTAAGKISEQIKVTESNRVASAEARRVADQAKADFDNRIKADEQRESERRDAVNRAVAEKWDKEQAEARLASEDRARNAQRDRLLKYHQEMAAKGYASAECSLGKRYLIGDGVPKDLALARAWLEKSAAQDNAEARAALQKLTHPAQSP